MGEIETLDMPEMIKSIVSDKLQVSYKWLSRNFLVPSNAAKRLLQEFVDKYGNEVEVIYSLSGWLKNNPKTYHVQLVSKHKLSDAKQELDENCSIQVYSVQACLPKDLATLWNQEFVQAEDLFKQPQKVDNCLLDNRFCGVSNPCVKRFAGEIPQPSPIVGAQSLHIAENVKTDIPVKLEPNKGAETKEKVSHLLPNTKKGQTNKNPSGSGSALANMWGRASTKSKPDNFAQTNSSKQNAAASAEAQICAQESIECGSSDEDGQDFSVKRASNGEGTRKRRVIFDYSDEEDEYQNAVNLASPDLPKKSTPCTKDSSKAFGLESNLCFKDNEDKPKINKTEANVKANQHLGEKVSSLSKGNETEYLISEKATSHTPKLEASIKDKVVDTVPKRRKVLKTRIDERGREVSEVVWEGEEPDTKTDNNSAKTAETNPINRPPVARKSPAVGNSAPGNAPVKAGNKKAGNKDPKQGNILSFFKKV